MESRGSADGERKTITALFADLKGSTALIEGLDPEDARAIIDPALQLMMDAVHRYEGYVRLRHLCAIWRADSARRSPAAGTVCGTADAGRDAGLFGPGLTQTRHPTVDAGRH